MPRQTIQHKQQAQTDAARYGTWPGPLALLAIALLYLLLSENRSFGPFWLSPIVLVLAAFAALLAERQRAHRVRRWLVLGANALVTASLASGIVLLIYGLGTPEATPATLLRDALLLWLLNIVTFALWYWELDNGGPLQRSRSAYRSSDLLFPQKQLEPAGVWQPAFMDYLFLAFNTNTAFSPTDTLVLSRTAKLCMMSQSMIALIDVAVIVARAVSTLQS